MHYLNISLCVGEVACKAHVNDFELSHNVRVTDVGVRTILSASSSLHSLILTNCPTLTDEAIRTIYEANVAWGKKRNRRASTLHSFDVKDNFHLSTQVLFWISVTAFNLTSLDVRNCPNMDLTTGIPELVTLKSLKHLYLGPCNNPVVSKRFALSMEPHMVRHVTQHSSIC